jgi:hypothetical protein
VNTMTTVKYTNKFHDVVLHDWQDWPWVGSPGQRRIARVVIGGNLVQILRPPNPPVRTRPGRAVPRAMGHGHLRPIRSWDGHI